MARSSAFVIENSIKSADRSEITSALISAEEKRPVGRACEQKPDAEVARARARDDDAATCRKLVASTSKFHLRGTFSTTCNMSAARKRKRFASQAARRRRASAFPSFRLFRRSNDNLVDPFCRCTSAVCSKSGPKYDIATYSADTSSEQSPPTIAINHPRACSILRHLSFIEPSHDREREKERNRERGKRLRNDDKTYKSPFDRCPKSNRALPISREPLRANRQ